MPEVCNNTVTNMSKDMQETPDTKLDSNLSKEVLEALKTNTNTSKEMHEEFNNTKAKTSKDIPEACNNTAKNTSKEAFKNTSKKLPEVLNETDTITSNDMPEAIDITGINTLQDSSEAFKITNTNTSQDVSKVLNIIDTKTSEDRPEPDSNVGNNDDADFIVDTDIHIDHHPPILMNDDTCTENVKLPNIDKVHQNEIVEIHHHTLQDPEKSFDKNCTNLAEDSTYITVAGDSVVFTRESRNDGPSTSETSFKEAQNTELRIVDAFHITSSRAQKTTIEEIMMHTHKLDTLNDTANVNISLNQCQSDDDAIDALPDEIQAELSVHAEYHRLKSNSTERCCDLNNCDKRVHTNTECYSTIAPISENAIKKEIHETDVVQCNSTSRPLAGDTNYFGSESSTFLVSNASASRDQLAQGHVIEELTASSEVSELGLDDTYLEGFTQITDTEGPTAQEHCSRNTEFHSGRKGKANNMKSSAETTLVDSSSISKIKSLWAKICPSQKPSNHDEALPKKMGKPKSSKIDETKRLLSLPGCMRSGENIHRKIGRPKGSGGKKTMTIQSSGEDSPRKRGRPRGSWCNKVMAIQSPGVLSCSENSPKEVGKPKGSGDNKSMAIQSFPLVLSSGEDSPKKVGRPKGSRGKKTITIQSHPGVMSSGADSPRKRGRPKGSGGNKTLPTSSLTGFLNKYEILPRKRGRPKVSGNSQNKAVQTISGPLGEKKQNTLATRNVQERVTERNIQNFETRILLKEGVMARENQRNVEEKNFERELNMVGDSELLDRFNITPCKVRLPRLDVSGIAFCVARREGIDKRSPTGNQCNRFDETSLKHIDRPKIYDSSDIKLQKLIENSERKDKSKAEQMKREKNNKLYEMKLKFEYSVPEITINDDIEDDCDTIDLGNLSDDEYTPTNKASLRTAFVKSQKSKKGNLTPKQQPVRRKIDYSKTKPRFFKKTKPYNKTGTCRIGAPPKFGHFECKKCDFTANEKNLVEKHHKREHALPWIGCNHCEYKSRSSQCLLEHGAKVHNMGKPFKCSYDGCLYASTNRTDLHHHQFKHATEKSYSCSKCNYKTKWKKNVKHHQRLVHSDVRNFKCDICMFTCKRNTDLKQHIFRHTSDKPLSCTICGFKVKTNWELKSHMLIHSDEKPFRCKFEGCKAAAKTNADLLKHVRQVHTFERTFLCSLCGKAYKDQQALKKHHNYVHVSTRSFVCDICSKAFKCKPALKKHILFHEGFKPHRCPVCKKTFAVRHGMKKHLETHDFRGRPFRCPLCPYGAKESDHLLAHIGTFHGDSYCYFCELCYKPFQRYGMLRIHYQRMHKSNLPSKKNNGDQMDLALVKMEKELLEEDSKRRKRKKAKRNDSPIHSKKIKEEQVDDGYKAVKKTTETVLMNKTGLGLASDDVLQQSEKRVDADGPTAHIPLTGPENREPIETVDEPSTDKVIEPSTDKVNEPSTDKVKEPSTDKVNEPSTDKVIEPSTDKVNEPSTDKVIEPSTDKVIEPSTDKVIEPSTDKVNEPSTDKVNEPSTDKVKEPSTDKVNEPSTDKVNESVNADQESSQMELKEEVDEETLKMNTSGTATLAIYDSLRLSLATKGFSFNYEKNGKKPKAWFMNVDCMNPTDADKQKTYLRKVEHRSRKRNECKNLSTFLKQRTENRNKSIWKSKMIRSLDNIPKQGRPCKKELSTNYEETEHYEQKRSIPRSAKFKGGYSELDTEAFEEVFSETDSMGNERNLTDSIDKSVVNNAKVSSEMGVTDNSLSEIKKKRGRPKKICQIDSFVEEDKTEKSQSTNQTSVESCHTERIKAEFVTHHKRKRGRPKKVCQMNSSEEEYMKEGTQSRKQTKIESCHTERIKAEFMTHHEKKRGRPKKVCQMNSSEEVDMTEESQSRKQTNYESCHSTCNKSEPVRGYYKKKRGRPKIVFQMNSSEEDMTDGSQSREQTNIESCNAEGNNTDLVTCHYKKKRGRPKKVCQVIASLEENMPGTSQSMTQMNVESSLHKDNRNDFLTCKLKKKQGRPKKIYPMNTSGGETVSVRSEDITNQTHFVSSQNEDYKTDLTTCSKSTQVKHKRKLKKDDSEHQIVKPKWQKKYIPVKMRKKGLQKGDSPKTSRTMNYKRMNPPSKHSKFVCEGSLHGETPDRSCTSERPSRFVQTNKTGHIDKQKLKSNNQGATSDVKPDLTNYCDDVLAMKTSENIQDLFGENIKLANGQNTQPCVSNGANSTEAENLRMQSNYLNYKINLNPPEKPKGSHVEVQCNVNGPTDDGAKKSGVINETFENLSVKIEPHEESEIKNA